MAKRANWALVVREERLQKAYFVDRHHPLGDLRRLCDSCRRHRELLLRNERSIGSLGVRKRLERSVVDRWCR